MGLFDRFEKCPGDIWSVSWRHLIVVLEIFIGVLVIFVRSLGDMRCESCRYLMCDWEIFDLCPVDI